MAKLTIDQLQKVDNIAELLDDTKLAEISQEVLGGYRIDDESRQDWLNTINEAIDIAMQIMDHKDFPWDGCSNIKYPLITEAAIEYASQTIPEILQTDRIVKMNVVGSDPDNSKFLRAERVSTFISYDLTSRSPDWVDGTDKLLQILPVVGTVFKKTYYNELERRICSDLCNPMDIVINAGAQSLDAARRITHKLKFYKDDIISRQRLGIYLSKKNNGDTLDVDCLTSSFSEDHNPENNNISFQDNDAPLEILEQHCYIDLDEDGYKEPYIVTIHKDSGQIFRIKARFKNVELNAKKKIIRIGADQSFTDYHFIRSSNGCFYSVGFGSLLLPLNKAINSLCNQLIDSGTLNNTQGGLLGSGIRLKNGELKFKMGRWQHVSMAAGEEISRNVFPWPTKEPSQTLFQLLGLMLRIGKDLSSTTKVMQDQQPLQNVASNTVNQLIEQGSKVFVAINKRLYRSLRKEFQKIYYLNSLHLTNEEYMNVLDDPLANKDKDFELSDCNIMPAADPTVSTEAQRMFKANIIHQLSTIDHREADKYTLQSMQIDQAVIDKLIPKDNVPVPPEQQIAQAKIQKIQTDIANISAQATLKTHELQIQQAKLQQDIKNSEAQIQYYSALVWKLQQDALHNMRKDNTTETKMQAQEQLKSVAEQHKQIMDQHAASLEEIRLAHEIMSAPAPSSIIPEENKK